MPPVSVMIKPASGLCNMRCRYCFYEDETNNREQASYGVMTPETLEAVLRRVLEHASGTATIAFQGGEPTLAGLPFFRQVVELEKKLNVHRVQVENAIQTNGYVLDEEWASFFAENDFLVGLSLDGYKELHDKNRPDAAGKGTYARVMHAAQLLQKHNVRFNILSVVTRDTCRSIRRVYGFFGRSGFDYQQYIPCLDPIGEVRGGHDYSLTPEAFERYLIGLFDCWYQEAVRGNLRYNRYFTNLLLMMTGRPPEACGMSGVCGRQYVVEADGGVYPCDFYVLDEWRLGSFVTDTFEQIEEKRRALGFIEMSKEPHPDCLACEWGALCRGGCRRDREGTAPDGGLGKNYFCTAYKAFFAHAVPKLQHIIALNHGFNGPA